MRKRSGPKIPADLIGELKPRTVYLDDMTWRKLRVIGKGYASPGIREAARVTFDLKQDTTSDETAAPDPPTP